MTETATNELVEVDIATTRDACVGSAASYLMRRISLNAGQPDPGVYEWVFYPLLRSGEGGTLDAVETWMEHSLPTLHRLGYRLCGRRVAFQTDAICSWVASGNGFRGAVLETNGARLRPELQITGVHAVAVTAPLDGPAELILIDPWPSPELVRRPPPTLERAHRDRKYGTIVFYWSGWS